MEQRSKGYARASDLVNKLPKLGNTVIAAPPSVNTGTYRRYDNNNLARYLPLVLAQEQPETAIT